MRVVLLGASGAGKGTQAQALTKHFNMKHISTGDILREEVKKDSAICRAVKRLMDRGDLIPDELMLSILEGVLLEENHFILDGFPRTYAQTLALDAICERIDAPIDVAIFIDVPDNEVVQRITGRWVCSSCAAMYHNTFLPPKQKGKCDNCETELTQRPDDTVETVRRRLTLFHSLTEPIVDFYNRKGILITKHGVGDAEQITADLIKELEARRDGNNN